MNWISRIALVMAMLLIGNNAFTKETFTKPSMAELRKTLSPLQFKVTQQDGTEPPSKTPTGIIRSRGSMSISSRENRSLAL